MIDSGLVRRGTARAEDAQGTPTQSHISPSLLVHEHKSFNASECRYSGFGFRFSVFGLRVSGFRSRVSGYGFRVSGFEFYVSSFGFRFSGFGFRFSVSGGADPAVQTLSHLQDQTENLLSTTYWSEFIS